MSVFMRSEKWLGIGTLLVILISSLGAYHFYKSWKTSSSITLPIPDCELSRSPCVSTLESGERIELRIKPTHMPLLTSVQLEVKTDKIPVKQVSINFKGAEMDMGEFSYMLVPQKNGVFSAQTILPTCIQDNMVWHAVVQIETSNKRYNAPFVLVNHKPHDTSLPHGTSG